MLNASVVDNAPLSILEALAGGLPIVTTSAGGIPVMVSHEETASVALVGDPRTLADHGLWLLSEPAFAAKLLRQGHPQLALHRWSSVRVEWLEIYAAKMS